MQPVDKNIIVKKIGIKGGFFKIDGTPYTLSDDDISLIEDKIIEVELQNNINQHNNIIYKQLDSIDLKTIRAVRTNDTDRLDELELQAQELRDQLK